MDVLAVAMTLGVLPYFLFSFCLQLDSLSESLKFTSLVHISTKYIAILFIPVDLSMIFRFQDLDPQDINVPGSTPWEDLTTRLGPAHPFPTHRHLRRSPALRTAKPPEYAETSGRGIADMDLRLNQR